MNIRIKILLVLSLVMLRILSACNNKPQTNKIEESLSSGEINIALDESLRLVMNEQLKIFDSSFPNATINKQYLQQEDCFNELMQGNVRLIIAGRDLTPEEKEFFKQKDKSIRSLAIAEDGVGIIVNKKSEDSFMTLGVLEEILKGTFLRKYNIVFESGKSGMVRYITDSLIPYKDFTSNVYALGSVDSVIDYVSKNENALGLVSSQYLYDKEDISPAGNFIKNVNVVAMRNDNNNKFFRPHQAYLATMDYPLRRVIYFHLNEGYAGLGTGFVNFLSQQRGQLIFNKSKLVPLRVPLELREAELVP